MATTTIEKAIVISVPPTLLGPESDYEKGRIALRNEYDPIIAASKKIEVVETLEQLKQANDAGRVLQAGSKDCEAFFRPIKQQIDAIKKPVLDAENAFVDELDSEKRRLGGIITAYNVKKEQERRVEEARQREEAEKAEREAQLNRAIEAEAAGDTQTAEAILEEPTMPSPVVAQRSVPTRMSGQVPKTTYSCTVTDLMELVKAVASGKAKIQCIMADESYLNATARNDKDGFSIPGCKLERSNSTHFRS